MTNLEFSGNRPASQAQLAGLHESTKRALNSYGSLFLERGEKITGTHEGLPIVDGLPRVELLDIPGEVISKAVQNAGDTFAADDELSLMHWQAHYEHLADDEKLEFKPEFCTFKVVKRGSPEYEAWLDLRLDEDIDEWQIDRDVTVNDIDNPFYPDSEEQARVLPFVGSNWLDCLADGPSYLTRREYGVLASIVSALGIVKSMLPESYEPPLDE